jgi:hypothetical protein
MIQSFKEMLTNWNVTHGERTKLQHTYVAVALAGIVIAGLVGLLNHDVSQLIVVISLASLGVAIVNEFMWALLYSMVIVKLQAAKRAPRK